ncbi:MAG: hypothetical protein Q8S73_09495 [Deltaproteobacteria bacterium]|nr:hypothetical protein [Deltaproteobacteria bacterium]
MPDGRLRDALEFGHEVHATHLVVCGIDHRCTDDLGLPCYKPIGGEKPAPAASRSSSPSLGPLRD